MAKKKKRKKRKSGNINPKTKNKLQHTMPDKHAKEAVNGKKMSEVILEFAEPLMHRCENDDQQKKIIALSIVAWNISCLPENQQEQSKKEAVKKFLSGDIKAQLFIEDLLNYLLERKKKYFSHDKRVVINYQICELDDTFNLMVASSVLQEDKNHNYPRW